LTPPDTLKGLFEMWNGMFGAFDGKSFRWCHPYKPHAWPIEYELLTHDTIVGAAAFGKQALLVTTGIPLVVAGASPSQIKNGTPVFFNQAGVSKRSVRSVGHGVCWASAKGLAYHGMVGPTRLLTEGVISEAAWEAINPSSIIGARWKQFYIGFYNADGVRRSFMIDTLNPISSVIWLTQGAYGVFQDTAGEALYILDTTFRIRKWDSGVVQQALIKSGIELVPGKTCPSAARVIGTTYPCTFTLWALLQTANPDAPAWTQIISKTVTNDQPFRLPGGYASDQFQRQIVGTGPCEGVFVADDISELP
jgi:hypothetical protein